MAGPDLSQYVDQELDELRNTGETHYQFLATLDAKTCPVCGALDGRRFPIAEAKRGVNLPPMHDGCRCTVTGILDPELEELAMRSARREDGSTYRVPVTMTWKKWTESYKFS